MYKVIVDFADLQDKEHVYRAGDTFPRFGFSVTEKRLKELSSSNNRRGIPLIEKVEEEKPKGEKPVKRATKIKAKKSEE